MVIAMVSNLVALIHNPPNKTWITLGVFANKKECRLHICGFENVQNFRSPSRIRTVIECDRYLMLSGLALMVEGRKLGKGCIFGNEVTVGIGNQFTRPI